MDSNTKETLLALIDGLTKRQSSNFYYEGDKIIDEQGIKVLKNFIKNA